MNTNQCRFRKSGLELYLTRWVRITSVAVCLLAFAVGALAAEQTPRNVLVLGGTGKLGARVVRFLVDDGHKVTVFARAESDRSRIADLPVDYVTGDLLYAADIDAALHARKFDVVISAVRVQTSDTQFFERYMKPLTVHARATGVEQIIHHTAIGAGSNVETLAARGWDKVPGLFDRLRDQGAGEDILRASGVPYTIMRNAGIYPDDTPATGKAELTEDDTVLTSMTRADLALLTKQCFGNAACLNKTYHVWDPSLPWRVPRPRQDQDG
jgi:uncharacterized protein YbjT (DUF2867 family)